MCALRSPRETPLPHAQVTAPCCVTVSLCLKHFEDCLSQHPAGEGEGPGAGRTGGTRRTGLRRFPGSDPLPSLPQNRAQTPRSAVCVVTGIQTRPFPCPALAVHGRRGGLWAAPGPAAAGSVPCPRPGAWQLLSGFSSA
ncbi:unnamed protein product [Caretta caretta]